MPINFDDLQYAAGVFTYPIIGYLIEDVCERIALAGKMTATAANSIELLEQLGVDFNIIERELQKRIKKSRREIDDLFRDYAKEHYESDYIRLKASYIPFEENKSLQQIVTAYTKLAQEDFSNATQTIGMVDRFGKPMRWQKFYQNACDDVSQRVVVGGVDPSTAVREASENLAKKGIRTIYYESGQSISLEAGVRRNVMGFLGLMTEEISQYNYNAIGCDGWEISAHANSAEDHEDLQGRQYPAEKWEEIERGLKRRIGTLNCGHIKFGIILGVNEPQYRENELQKFKSDNAEGFTYITAKGNKVHYTGYRAMQHMRYIETAIRNWQRDYVVAVNTQNPDQTMIASSHIVRWRAEYKRFSNAAGLRMQPERHYAAGYREARKKAVGLGFVVPR